MASRHRSTTSGNHAMKMDGSWKKFYTERRGKYKSKFPFLKEDQITAKLRRIWYKERVSSGLTSGVQSSEFDSHCMETNAFQFTSNHTKYLCMVTGL